MREEQFATGAIALENQFRKLRRHYVHGIFLWFAGLTCIYEPTGGILSYTALDGYAIGFAFLCAGLLVLRYGDQALGHVFGALMMGMFTAESIRVAIMLPQANAVPAVLYGAFAISLAIPSRMLYTWRYVIAGALLAMAVSIVSEPDIGVITIMHIDPLLYACMLAFASALLVLTDAVTARLVAVLVVTPYLAYTVAFVVLRANASFTPVALYTAVFVDLIIAVTLTQRELGARHEPH